MKKAKVLVPALSMLCFSALACVAGTVAWFTSVTNATVSTSNFKIQALEGAMEVACTPGVATKLSGSGSGSSPEITVDQYTPVTTQSTSGKEDNHLTHGSFDPSIMQAWTVSKYGTGVYVPVGTAGHANFTKANENAFLYDTSGAGLFHVFSWDMTFHYDYHTSASAPDMDLYFDVRSIIAPTAESIDGDKTAKNAARGFRLAFVNTDSYDDATKTYTDWVVWSPLQAEVLEQNVTATTPSCYVSSTSATTEYNPNLNGNLIYKGDSITYISQQTGDNTRKDYLGKFHPTETAAGSGLYASDIHITCVAWFEGSDENVIRDSVLNSEISTTLQFYLRDTKKTA